MSEYVGFGQLKIVETQRRAEREAAEATGREPAPGQTPAAGPAPAGQMPAASTASGMPPVPAAADRAPAAATEEAADRAPAASAPPVAHAVEWKRGYLQLPNWLVFNFLPRLRLDERVVWEELYIWTHGFGQNPRIVSQKKICARLGIDEKRLYRIIAKLEAKGFVRNLGSRLGGEMGERGTLFDVVLPEVTGAPPAGSTPAAGRVPAAPPGPAAGKAPDMKRDKKREEENPVYEIRTIAARIFEARRREPGFDREQLREAVSTVLLGEGRSVDDDVIDKAIRGMAS